MLGRGVLGFLAVTVTLHTLTRKAASVLRIGCSARAVPRVQPSAILGAVFALGLTQFLAIGLAVATSSVALALGVAPITLSGTAPQPVPHERPAFALSLPDKGMVLRDILSTPAATFLGVSPVELPTMLPHTDSAASMPSVNADPCVLPRELVSADAFCFPRVRRRVTPSAPNVHAQAHRLQVFGVDAATVPAQMVKRQAPRHATNQCLIAKAVCVDVPTVRPILSVSVDRVRLPVPASPRTDLHFLAESVRQSRWTHLPPLSPGEGPNSHLNERGLRHAEALGELAQKPEAFAAQAEAVGLLHVLNVADCALPVNALEGEV